MKALCKCKDLCGIMIATSKNKQRLNAATDEGMAEILKSCPKLSWIYVDDFGSYAPIFDIASWKALYNGACPNLKVL